MDLEKTFRPDYTTGQNITTGAASATVDLGIGHKYVRLHNTGSNDCYISIGQGNVTASDTGLRLHVGEIMILAKSENDDTLAHIQITLGTTVHLIQGEGI